MKKHLQILALIAAFCMPWMGYAQTLDEYGFATGTDASKWITVPTSITSMISANAGDYGVSTVHNLGFSFPFAEESYTQFSVNADGNLRLGGTVTGTSYYSTPFSSTNANYNNPKINMLGCDGYVSSSHYVRYLHTADANGDSVGVVEFCVGTYTTTTRENLYKWQVHLYHNGTIEVVFGTAPAAGPAVTQQRGLCTGASDGWFIDGSHAATHFTNGTSATIASGVWPTNGRYYTFTLPNYSCPKPIRATVSNLTYESFDISWTDTSDATSWLVRFDSAGVVGLVNEVYDTTMSFTGLTQNTPYVVNIAGLCSNGDTSAWRTVSLRTPCSYFTIPYTEDFESYGTGTTAFPTCWYRKGSTADRPYVNATTSYGHNNTHGLYFYGASGGYCYAIMPPTNHSIDSLQVSFWARQYSTSYNCSFAVGVMTDPNDISTFVAVDTVHPATTTYEQFDVSLSRYTGTGQYIAFSAIINSGSYIYLMLDDVTVDYLPTCPHVENLRATYVGTDTIILAWNSGSMESSWMVSDGTNEYEIYDSTYIFDQLNPNTSYTFTVRAVCGYDDTSRAATLTVRTSCGDLRVPYTEDFESYGTGTTAFPSCWFKKGSTADRPYINATTSYGHNNTHGLYFYAASGGYCYAIMPRTSHAIDSLQVTFWARQYSTSYDCSFAVGVMTDPNNTSSFVAVDTVHPSSTTYEMFEVPLNNYTGTGKYIAFSSIINSGSSNYLMLDDVTVDYIPGCPRPNDFRAVAVARPDSVVIAWDEAGDATAWQIFLGSVGALPTEDSVLVDVYDQTYTFTTLTSGVSYDVYVRSDCGTGEYSNWCGPLTITPGSITLPVTGTLTTSGCGLVIYDDGGPTGNYSVYCNATLTINPPSPDSLVVLSGTFAGESTLDYLDIIDGTSSGVSLAHITSGTSGTVINFGPFTSTTGPLTIHFYSDVSNNYQGFEIHTSCIAAPECADVQNVVANVGTTSAYVTWTVSAGTLATPAGYELEVGGVTYTTTDQYYFVTMLDTNTAYSVKVRSICDGGGYGNWDSVTFTTGTLPCVEFDTIGGGGATYAVGTPGTSTTSVMPVNGDNNYSYCNHLILASEINTGGPVAIGGIDFDYAASSPMTHTTNCSIYMCHTTMVQCDNFAPTSDLQLVYVGPLNCTTNGWNHFDFNQSSFAYDGVRNIMVAIVKNSGATEPGSLFRYQQTTPHMSHRVYNDATPYDMAAMAAATASNSFWRTNMRLTTGSCIGMASCAAPHVILTHFDATSADIIWAPGLDETAWDVDYRAMGDTTWTNVLTGTSATSVTITGLAANVSYEVRVVNHCTDGDFDATVSFLTPCDALPLPFAENFDTWPTGYNFPNCWNKGTNYTTNYPSVSTSYALSGSNSLYMYSSNTSYSYVVLPQFQVSIDSLEVTFALRKTNTSYSHNILVGVMTDPSDFSTFTQVASVAPSQLNVWEQFAVALNSYSGNGQFIALVSPNSVYSYPYLDNLGVSVISSCMRPENVSAHDITMTDATISWTDTVTTDFVVEYGPSGFAMGTGTVVTTYADSVTLTGLTLNTPYDVYVRGICGADTSSPSFAYSFRTACALIDSLPFTETFESQPTGTSSTGSPFIPCWTRLNNGTSYAGYPYVSNSTTYNHTPGGSKGLYWYATTTTGSYGDYQYVILPNIDTVALPINTLQLRFWAKSSSTSYNPEFRVGVMTDPTNPATFHPVDTINGFTDNWTEVEVPFTGYTGSGSYIAVMNVRPSSSWYAYVDDFTLEVAPTCARPNSVTMTANTFNSATINWTERAGATEWEVATMTSATATPVGDSVVNAHPLTLTGLTGGTHYYFYVRSICGMGDTSAWSDVFEFVPGSWNMRANMTDTVRMCGGVIYDEGGATGAYYTGSQNSTIIIMPDSPNNLISISGSSYTESSFDYITIYDGAGTSGTQLWTDNGISSLTNFGPFISTNGPITVTFHTDGSVFYDGFEINVSCVATYCRVMNVHLDGSVPQSDSQLAIVWDTNGATEYQVEYGPRNFTIGTGTRRTVYTNSVVLTGLNASTNYDVCVRSICGASDTGSWTRETFTTAMCDNAIVTAIGSASSTGSGYYVPINNYYNYTLTETIIDSAELDGEQDISMLSYYYDYSSPSTYKTNCTIYFQPTTKTAFSGTSDMVTLNTATAVKVYEGPLNCSQGWNDFALDTAYHYEGTGNLLVIVDDNSYDYDGSAYIFKNEPCSGYKSISYYSDSDDPNPSSPSSFSGNKGYYQYRPVMKLTSCGVAGCRQPAITGTAHTYESATVSWAGSGANYQVAIKESASTTWGAEIPVTGSSYTFYGLMPTTNYDVRVRQDCTADSLGYSEWAVATVLTDSLPCMAPQNLTVSDITNATASFSWTARGYETMWDIHVWYGSFDSTYTVTTNPATLSGFTAGVTYNAAIRPLCGSAHNIVGDYGDTVTFTTQVCPNVTGLSAGSVTASSVTLSWDNNTMAQSWSIEYGRRGFSQGSGTTATTATNSYVVNGLSDDTPYDFYVKAVCGTDWTSENWASVSATTAEGTVVCDAPENVTAVVAGNAATINWTAGDGNISFELEYGVHGFSHGAGTTATATTAPATISNLSYETQYDVYVRAICAQNTYSAWSTVATFTTEPEPSTDCLPVTNLTALDITDNSVVVTWTPGESGDTWEVVLASAAGETIREDITAETQHQFTGLAEATDYIVKVRTKCDDQYSNYVTVSFRTTGEQQGIDDVTSASCTIYPNPTSSATTVSVNGVNGQIRIAIVDMNGRVVTSETMECSADCTKTMDVENLAQGAYFVRITGENVNMVKKLIIK